jgi:hypothetical protein
MLSVTMACSPSYLVWNKYVHATNTHYDLVVFSEESPFINHVFSTPIVKKPIISTIGRNVTEAPLWLLQRMEALRRRPSPTLKEVETSFRAVEEMRSKYEVNPSFSASGRKMPVT